MEFLPAYYMIGKDLEDSQLENVLHYLRITPISAVLITNSEDRFLALKLSDMVLQMPLDDAHEFAQQVFKESGEAVAILTGEVPFQSYDSSGNSLETQESKEA